MTYSTVVAIIFWLAMAAIIVYTLWPVFDAWRGQ